MTDVKPTAEVITSMAETARRLAVELERIAKRMLEENDIERASEALTATTNALSNMRLDLLVTRPLREFLREKK